VEFKLNRMKRPLRYLLIGLYDDCVVTNIFLSSIYLLCIEWRLICFTCCKFSFL